MTNIQALLQQIAGKKVFLIGDVYLYETIYGEVEKLADDAPIPVVQKHNRTLMAGGAGYTAILLSRLGIDVTLFTVLGDDPAGAQLFKILSDNHVNTECVLQDPDYRTSSRTRVRVEGSKYNDRDMLRIQATDPVVLSEEKKEHFVDFIETRLNECSALVFQDHDKSIMTPKLLEALNKVTKRTQIPHIAMSDNQLDLLKKFDIVAAHVRSVRELLDNNRKKTDQPGPLLLSRLKCKTLFMTPGCEGINLVKTGGESRYFSAGKKHVHDVNGSHQAVLTAVTLGALGGWSDEDTAELANLVTSCVISRPGFSPVSERDLIAEEKRYQLNNFTGKHVNADQLLAITGQAKSDGKKVVWTNGCYDILHAGHVIYLERAKEQGDILVVGLNSDASVRRNKGDLRPVVEENERAKVLSALTCVDYVVIFDDTSPIAMIDMLKPDIYAKGGDYTIDTINQQERRLVEGYGGEIALLPGVPGMSTSEIINRVLKAYGNESN